MTRMIVNSRVGADGVLHMTVPVGAAEANREVQVTIESRPQISMTQAEWQEFIASTAGTWEGEFERPPQWTYEERDPL